MVVTGFGVGTEFAREQTEGDPLPEPPPAQMIDGAPDVGMRLLMDLIDFIELRGVSYGRERLPSAYGSYDPHSRRNTGAQDLNGDQARPMRPRPFAAKSLIWSPVTHCVTTLRRLRLLPSPQPMLSSTNRD